MTAEKELQQEAKAEKKSIYSRIVVIVVAFLCSIPLIFWATYFIPSIPWAHGVDSFVIYIVIYLLLYFVMKRSRTVLIIASVLFLLLFMLDINREESFFKGIYELIAYMASIFINGYSI